MFLYMCICMDVYKSMCICTTVSVLDFTPSSVAFCLIAISSHFCNISSNLLYEFPPHLIFWNSYQVFLSEKIRIVNLTLASNVLSIIAEKRNV